MFTNVNYFEGIFVWNLKESVMKAPEIAYTKIKQSAISGRYVHPEQITTYVDSLPSRFNSVKLGASVQGRAIYKVSFGKGDTKILMWSQMHGNEATTTKAVIDLLNFLKTDHPLVAVIANRCTLEMILQLNPDGALVFSRVNANLVDLNRDAQQQSQPESRILRTLFDTCRPDFAFNLHDQRTIFNVGLTPKPATVSFLAPALDKERSISTSRRLSMQLIAAMNQGLQQMIPGQVGRFDDSFNPNCVGDCFQMLHTPTVLFEAGHFHEDYEREKTREYIFWALYKALDTIANDTLREYDFKEYLSIPENNTLFFDVVVKNVHLLNPKYDQGVHAGILYKEKLHGTLVHFEPVLSDLGLLEGYFGHKTFDCTMAEDLSVLQQSTHLVGKLLR
ncbi:M14 family zinc carboxypeptidase [Arenibacter sp. GZD96]|uniref:M14 family zinc carboxypeptidase n=1 Tax=Aurantibrevibacter litoralis TaxID=3106030 RepID=UPI002AFFEABD|nr:M14 family zinc carboxypeptidase [Arenibacter sp. GZD-96]MEA1785375.1 M14 family zinc carboxypeptidase [Arenibacter sp. GZD-96]